MDVVTGATGHIGNTLVRELVARGREVRCLVLPSESTKPLYGLETEIVYGDVRRPETLYESFRGADVVYHLASVIALTGGHRALLEAVNVRGARNVAEACLRAGVRRLVYTSSIHALAEPPKGVAIDESCPFDPTRIKSDYGRSKARATLEVLGCVNKGLDAVIVCPAGVIGPNDFAPSETGRVFVAYARGAVRFFVQGGYDFVDVRDVAVGHIAAAERGRRGETYLLSGEQISVRDLMVLLSELTGVPAPRSYVPGWVADAAAPFVVLWSRLARTKPLFTGEALTVLRSNSLASNTKARRELGWQPRPIAESIADTVQWLSEAGMLRLAPKFARRAVPSRSV